MMPRRRSARLASATKSKAIPELSSVAEQEEPIVKKPSNPTPVPSSPVHVPSTPASSGIKPPYDEMHPSKAHTTTGPPSSALRLGFTDIKSNDKSPSQRRAQDVTPSRVNRAPSSEFTFRASPQIGTAGLSNDAQLLMNELRDQAAKIKADLISQREASEESLDPSDRKVIKPKGKTGRFSAAHMAEFKKMDSIEGHASAWRAQEGRFTPIKSALKRTPSKADLDAAPAQTPVKSTLKRSTAKLAVETTPTPAKPSLKRSSSKAELDTTPSSRPRQNLKRKSSAANLDLKQELAAPTPKIEFPLSPSKLEAPAKDAKQAGAKRLKKRLEDDSSSARPISRDGSSIPQPTGGSGSLTRSQSSLTRLTSPTKASLAHTSSTQKPTITLVASPPQQPNFEGLKKSATTQSLNSPSKVAELKRRIISPGRFQKVKSILRGTATDSSEVRSAIPQPMNQVSQTPGPRGSERMLPPVPLTTPRRKLVKHVSFTPEVLRTASTAAAAQNSPSPQKFSSVKFTFTRNKPSPHFPTVNEVLAQSKTDDVVYPDLSSLERKTLGSAAAAKESSSTPGTFTFRSDHTIEFGAASPSGFGASPGQSSVRHVRKSVAPVKQMPGSFPDVSSKGLISDKENTPPVKSPVLLGVPHGMSNKKRHRASSDEEDAEREASERAAKKRKHETVPDGQVVLKARPIEATPTRSVKKTPLFRAFSQTPSRTPSKTPVRTPGTVPASASPTKKRAMLSMSRLNMLARPKNRA